MSQLYKKENNKYVKIGYTDGFSGFPAEGLWLVFNGDGRHSSERIFKIDDLDKEIDENFLVKLHIQKNELIDLFVELRESGTIEINNMSMSDLANIIINKLVTNKE